MQSRKDPALLCKSLFGQDAGLHLLDGEHPPAPSVQRGKDAAHPAFSEEFLHDIHASQERISFTDPEHLKSRCQQFARQHAQFDQGLSHRAHCFHCLLIAHPLVLKDDRLVPVRGLIAEKAGVQEQLVRQVVTDHAEHLDAPGKTARHAEGDCILRRQRKGIYGRVPVKVDRKDRVAVTEILYTDLHDNVQHVEHFQEADPVPLVIIFPGDVPVLVEPFRFYILFLAVTLLGLLAKEGLFACYLLHFISRSLLF